MDGNFDYVSDPAGSAEPDEPTVPLPADPHGGQGRPACVSIAAASIVAKVTRDRLMRSMAEPASRPSTSTATRDTPRRCTVPPWPASASPRCTGGPWSYVDELAFR